MSPSMISRSSGSAIPSSANRPMRRQSSTTLSLDHPPAQSQCPESGVQSLAGKLGPGECVVATRGPVAQWIGRVLEQVGVLQPS